MMKKQSNKTKNKSLVIVIVIFVILFFLGVVLGGLMNNGKSNLTSSGKQIDTKIREYNFHESNDLKISFRAPIDWIVDGRYGMLLLANYNTNLNKKSKMGLNNIEINIYKDSLCKVNLDEQVRLGGCFIENNWLPTEILNEQVNEISSGTLYKYLIKHPQNEKQIIYYLKNGNRILKISKKPDFSRFENEFMDIISSIKFL